MMLGTCLLLSIFIPIGGSILVWLFRGKLRNAFSVLMILSSFVLSCVLLLPVLKGTAVETKMPSLSSDFFSLSFVGDAAGLIFALIFSLLGTIAALYSLEYMKGLPHQTEYYSMLTLMVGSLMGIAFAENLILLYIFWEIATLTTWRLVGFHRGKRETAIANKTFLMIFAGSTFMLLGFIMLYTNVHTFDLVGLRGRTVGSLTLIFIFFGIITKAAILPVHNWLPDAHTVAPSPVSALLSGIVVKIGMLAFFRVFIWTFGVSWDWILILAVISSIVAAAGALLETDMKKIIAYSTVSQMGFMLLGFAILSEIGVTAGLVYFIVHAVGKAGLFLCAGIVEKKCGERNIHKLGGLVKVLPVTAAAFAFCALSIIGLPPFGGFFGKIMVVGALVERGNIWMAALAVFAAILTLLYLLRLFSAVFLGDLRFGEIKEGSNIMIACAFFLGIISLAIGLLINHVLGLINIAVLGVL